MRHQHLKSTPRAIQHHGCQTNGPRVFALYEVPPNNGFAILLEFQQVIEDYPLPLTIRPQCFDKAMTNFKPYFLGKVLSEVSPLFKHADLVNCSHAIVKNMLAAPNRRHKPSVKETCMPRSPPFEENMHAP